MKAKLVAVSKPTNLIASEDGKETTAEDLIVYCARVSNPKNQLRGRFSQA
jgi:hypothetical protein